MSRNPLEDAQLGDILIDPNGQEWKVIAFTTKPTVTLQRVRMADVFDHTRQSVIASSSWAASWQFR